MKSNKYAEIPNLVQVIGCIFKNPKLLERDDKYKFNEQDFYDEFHQLVFGCMYNLWQLGVKEITLPAIEDYLTQRPKALAIYKANKGGNTSCQICSSSHYSCSIFISHKKTY